MAGEGVPQLPDGLALAHPDWLRQILTVSGPAAVMARFRAAAAGSGVIPWVLDLHRLGPDDPAAQAWLWHRRGNTRALRQGWPALMFALRPD